MLQARSQGLLGKLGGVLQVPGVERRQDGVEARLIGGGIPQRLSA